MIKSRSSICEMIGLIKVTSGRIGLGTLCSKLNPNPNPKSNLHSDIFIIVTIE